MTSSAADDGSSLAPTVTEGETTAEAGAGAALEEGAEDKEMKVGAAAAVEHLDVEAAGEEDPDEEEVEEGEDEDDEEEEEDEDEEEDAGEVETADVIEAESMEPLALLKPGDGVEELDEEPEEAEPSEEETEEVELVKEGDSVVDEGLVDGSVANKTNEISKQEHGKSGNTNKDKNVDQLSCDNDNGVSTSGDMQNSELAGGLEIFVDNLPQDCSEEDIAMVFSQYGEVKSVRIIKNSSTEKNKDIAFVCYGSIEAAKKALAEFKEGIEVKGKMVRVSACQDNNTLYLGNICKGWTRDEVQTTLTSIGIQECKISLPTYKGGSRGFAFLKFSSHYYARAAFRRLMKPDAIFGTDRSAKVSFYQSPRKPTENLMEAKKVYLEHVPLSWDDDRIKELCEEYGEILKVDLFQISKNKEDEAISFVEFSSSKGALACVEGIKKTKIVDGGFKMSAYLARPKGDLNVNSAAASEAATTTEKDKNHSEKVVVDNNSPHKFRKGNKSKLTSRTKEAIMKTKPSTLPNDNDAKLNSQGAAEVPETSKPSEVKRKVGVGKNKNASVDQSPLKARNNRNVDESQLTYRAAVETSKRKRKGSKHRSVYINEKPLKKARNNSNLSGSSRSKSYASDLEPHAGFISPAIQDHGSHAYNRQRTAQNDTYPIDVHPYARDTAASPSAYSGYRSHAAYEAGYAYYPRDQLPPPSGSYYLGTGSHIPRRGHY